MEEETSTEGSVHRAPSVHSACTEAASSPETTSVSITTGVASTDSFVTHNELSVRKPHVRYTDELAEFIVDRYVEGDSLSKIARIDGMPAYGTIISWTRNNEVFRKMMEGARAARALHFEDKALAAADEVLDMDDKDRAAVARLRFDAFKWGAEVNDPAQYGKKTTISGDAGRPIVFQIVTGIPAPEGPAVTLDKTGIVQDVVETSGEVLSEDVAAESVAD